jgi:hypothetical protein
MRFEMEEGITGFIFFLCFLITTGCLKKPSYEAADIVLYNGKILTME